MKFLKISHILYTKRCFNIFKEFNGMRELRRAARHSAQHSSASATGAMGGVGRRRVGSTG